LSPEQIRRLLRECVTVVKPGETLVIRGRDWTPSQLREIQQAMDDMYQLGQVSFRALAVPGDELGTALEPEFMAETRVEPVDGSSLLIVRLTHLPTGISVDASSRAEAIVKLGRAIERRALREAGLAAVRKG
jgi:hypothetical protein